MAIMQATNLTIRQAEDSLGLWVPGEPLRDVSWGRVERDGVKIQAGWNEDAALVIRSEADGGTLTEIYGLSEDRGVLRIQTTLTPVRGERQRITRYYDRQGDPPPSDGGALAGERHPSPLNTLVPSTTRDGELR